MTLIAAVGFLDESYLLSDSRVSYTGGIKPSEDRLMKVYQLAPTLAVAFTSQHVDFTLEILRRITKFSLANLTTKRSRFILPYLIRLANFEYKKLSKELGISPIMEFIYCGVVNKPQMFSSYLMFDLLKQMDGPFAVPEKIGRAMMERAEGIWSLQPPCPIIYKQFFPYNPDHPYIHLGYTAGGSGQEVFEEIKKEYAKLFNFGFGLGRGIILEQMVNDFIKVANIPSIGGIIQVWRINDKGLQPIAYAWKQHSVEGTDITLKELKFIDGTWVLVNHQTGETTKATFANNPYIQPDKKAELKTSSWSNY